MSSLRLCLSLLAASARTLADAVQLNAGSSNARRNGFWTQAPGGSAPPAHQLGRPRIFLPHQSASFSSLQCSSQHTPVTSILPSGSPVDSAAPSILSSARTLVRGRDGDGGRPPPLQHTMTTDFERQRQLDVISANRIADFSRDTCELAFKQVAKHAVVISIQALLDLLCTSTGLLDELSRIHQGTVVKEPEEESSEEFPNPWLTRCVAHITPHVLVFVNFAVDCCYPMYFYRALRFLQRQRRGYHAREPADLYCCENHEDHRGARAVMQEQDAEARSWQGSSHADGLRATDDMSGAGGSSVFSSSVAAAEDMDVDTGEQQFMEDDRGERLAEESRTATPSTPSTRVSLAGSRTEWSASVSTVSAACSTLQTTESNSNANSPASPRSSLYLINGSTSAVISPPMQSETPNRRSVRTAWIGEGTNRSSLFANVLGKCKTSCRPDLWFRTLAAELAKDKHLIPELASLDEAQFRRFVVVCRVREIFCCFCCKEENTPSCCVL
ncbi:unnamed protein product [Amoebophrya sp. A120]|nr:unnamed protein product [Amoebophrya sp. A120]|eukprot:GSA120T00022733001.1